MLVEDRHTDVEPLPFSTEEAAIAAARKQAADNAWHPEHIEEAELTASMREAGWVLCIGYSVESDRVRVVKRTLDA